MESVTSISPRVIRVLNLIDRLDTEERLQLARLLPPELGISPAVPEKVVAEAVTYFRAKAERRLRPPSLDDSFIGGLTYREYFALSDTEAEALWDTLAAEAPSLEELHVVEIALDARLPTR